MAGKNKSFEWSHILRLRTFIYFAAWAAVGVIMLVALLNRDRLDVNIVPDRNPLFVTLSDGAVRNGFTVKILNMKQEPRTFRITLKDLPGATMEMVGEKVKASEQIDVAVDPDKLRAVKLYVATGDETVRKTQKTDFSFEVTELSEGGQPESGSFVSVFHAPRQ